MIPRIPNSPPTSKRSRRQRKARNVAAGNVVPGILSVFPPRLTTTLPYVDELGFSTTSSSSAFGAEISYRMNSLFDPYFPVGGHQPFGFDQITPFYSWYIVNRVDVEITFSDPSADGVVVGVFAKNFNDASTLTGATVSAAQERPTNWVRNLNDSGSQVVTFRKSYNLADFMGLTKTQYEGSWPSVAARTTSDPHICPYLSLAVADSAAGSSKSVIARIRLNYHATFWGRQMSAGQS